MNEGSGGMLCLMIACNQTLSVDLMMGNKESPIKQKDELDNNILPL